MKTKLTPEELKTLHREANDVWAEIGCDVLDGMAASTGKSAETLTLSRRAVVEIVIDCARLEQRLKDEKLMTPALQALFDSHDGTLTRTVTKGFEPTRYGL